MIKLFRNWLFWCIVVVILVGLCFFFLLPLLGDFFVPIAVRLLILSTFLAVSAVIILIVILFVKGRSNEEKKRKTEEKRKRLERKKLLRMEERKLEEDFDNVHNILGRTSLFRKGRDHTRYDLPWYLLLGSSGVGKSFLLDNSGIKFPLEIDYTDRNVHEFGETPSIEWRFTEEAVFIDVPGRYFDALGGEGNENSLFEYLFAILARKRQQRPLNAIIFVIKAQLLLDNDEVFIDRYARQIRGRFDRICRILHQCLPIYLVVSGVDTLRAFNEYFSDINQEEKDQPFGVAFDEFPDGYDPVVAGEAVDELLRRINLQVPQRMQRESTGCLRSEILLFPAELDRLCSRLLLFAEIAFAATRYYHPLRARGFYFTGIPVPCHWDEQSSANLPVFQEKQGFFIKGFMADSVFPEADSVFFEKKYKKRVLAKELVALVLSVFFSGFILFYWIDHYTKRNVLLRDAAEMSLRFSILRDDAVDARTFKEILPPLTQASELLELADKNFPPLFIQPAFKDITRRRDYLNSFYKNTLHNILLTQIQHEVENRLKGRRISDEEAWEIVKIAIMLKVPERRDLQFLKEWGDRLWVSLYPGDPDTQKILAFHWDALLAYGFKALPISNEEISRLQKKIIGRGHAALLYRELKRKATLRNLPDFNFATSLGEYASDFSGTLRTIPGLYTREGFSLLFISGSKGVIRDLGSENWVAGYETEITDAEVDLLYSSVLSYYFAEYKREWLSALSLLQVSKYKEATNIERQLTNFTAHNSPLIRILNAVKKNTEIYTPAELLLREANNLEGEGEATKAKSVRRAAMEAEKRLPTAPVRNLRKAFARYHVLIKDDLPAPQLKEAIGVLEEGYDLLTSVEASIDPQNMGFETLRVWVSGADLPLHLHKGQIPHPVNGWLEEILLNCNRYIISLGEGYISERYSDRVKLFFEERVAGRFPFTNNFNSPDMALEDFIDFFKKGGIFDSYYTEYIIPFIFLDSYTKEATTINIDGNPIAIPESIEILIPRVLALRKRYFGRDGETLFIEFSIKAHELGKMLNGMILKYNGDIIQYSHGPIREHRFNWPSGEENPYAAFTLVKYDDERAITIEEYGEWALPKLMNRISDRYRVQDGAVSIAGMRQDAYFGWWEVRSRNR